MPKISILIPIYNVAAYLHECLDSVVNQTETDLEIICVDDASTDNSLNILEEYVVLDKRIRILRHEKNQGLCQTRKDAVRIANGDFIMFLDSDDYLSPHACETLYMEISKRKVDVIQFDTEILPSASVSKDMIEWVADFMRPSLERIESQNLLRTCFIEKKFNVNLVNKIWEAGCCRRAYSKIADGYYMSAEDRYATFLLSYYAKSYAGITEKHYHYRLGIGVTGGETLDMERFEKRCKGALVVEQVRSFLEEEGKLECYQEEFEAFRNDILLDCVDCWYNKLLEQDWGIGYAMLLKSWSAEDVVGVVAQAYFEHSTDILERIENANFSVIKNVGIYYRYLGYEPMLGYIEEQVRMLSRLGYQVVLFTDSDAPIMTQETNFVFDAIVFLPPAKDANWDKYKLRGQCFSLEVRRYAIGFMLYMSPSSHIAWLDALLMRSMGIIISYTDEKNQILLNEINDKYQNLLNNYEIVCLEKNQILASKTYKLAKWLKKVVHYTKEE